MCFAPQRRALFQHLNFQKWSEAEVFCTFWLGNVLRATTACTFSTSQLPKVVREWCVLYILTWKCASRHNGVQFFISHLASWLRTRRFSEPTFRPSGATNHWKNTVFRDFPTFSRIWIFCLLTLSLLIFLFSMPLPCSAFHLSILSEVSLLNFLRLSIYKIILRSILQDVEKLQAFIFSIYQPETLHFSVCTFFPLFLTLCLPVVLPRCAFPVVPTRFGVEVLEQGFPPTRARARLRRQELRALAESPAQVRISEIQSHAVATLGSPPRGIITGKHKQRYNKNAKW